jgi:hypothetical protein
MRLEALRLPIGEPKPHCGLGSGGRFCNDGV